MEDLIGDLSGNPQPIVVNLYSDDEQILADLPLKVADGLGKVNGVIDVDSGIVPAETSWMFRSIASKHPWRGWIRIV